MQRKMILLLALAAIGAEAFVPAQNSVSTRVETSALNFGIPTFQPKKDDGDKGGDKEEKIGLKGLAQLITAGMGAPFLGDFEGVDKDTGKMMFSLEANNLVDEEGKSKQTSMPYFESGWVDEADLEKERKRKEGGFKFPWQN
ncbi:unnamed protein product [Cylindrotheca closterium]|uniref:Uncharacterized protein n=1 Tax=Cylindrotheca closterium TaxID=2856 RepID=A0AAD2FZT4_9STRA|nr:unnamed protein product [Cylindrotheca closterium]